MGYVAKRRLDLAVDDPPVPIRGLGAEARVLGFAPRKIRGLEVEAKPATTNGLTFARFQSHARFHDSRKFVNLILGGYGSGKTRSLVMKTYQIARQNPGLLHVLAGLTYKSTRLTLVRTFAELLTFLDLPWKFNKSDSLLELPNGAQIQFLSAEHVDNWKGPNVAFFGLDEPGSMPEEAFRQAKMRTRDTRSALLQVALSTTPEGRNWLFEEVKHVSEEGAEDARIDVTRARTDDNVFLPPGFADEITRTYGPLLAAQYRDGLFLEARAGRVYYALERRSHAKPVAYNPDRALFLFFDFNHDPGVCALAHRDGDRFEFFAEVFLRNSTTGKVCKAVKDLTPGQLAPVTIYGDAAGGQRTANSESSNWQIVEDELSRHFGHGGFDFRHLAANPAILDRVNAVNRAAERGFIVIDPSLERLWRDFENVLWKPGTSEIQKKKAPSGLVSDFDDSLLTHISDAVGYGIHYEHPLTRPSFGGSVPAEFQ